MYLLISFTRGRVQDVFRTISDNQYAYDKIKDNTLWTWNLCPSTRIIWTVFKGTDSCNVYKCNIPLKLHFILHFNHEENFLFSIFYVFRDFIVFWSNFQSFFSYIKLTQFFFRRDFCLLIKQTKLKMIQKSLFKLCDSGLLGMSTYL